MPTNWRQFESPEEYATYLRAIPAHLICSDGDWFCSDGDWCGQSFAHGVLCLEQGDTTRLAQAQSIIDQLDLAHIFSNDVPILQSALAGFTANVPAAIVGHPEAMFRRGYTESPSVLAPLAVYVETSASQGVTTDQLIKRGVAVLAFVLAMETVRPVDLYCVSMSGAHRQGLYGAVVKVASRPMDLGRAVWMLTDPCYTRRLQFSTVNYQYGSHVDVVSWPFNIVPTQSIYEPKMRELLQLEPDDVFMKGGFLTDTLMLTNPVEWVRTMIAKHSSNHGE